MEVMDLSLDKFYKLAFDNSKPIPEAVLGKIAVAVRIFLVVCFFVVIVCVKILNVERKTLPTFCFF